MHPDILAPFRSRFENLAQMPFGPQGERDHLVDDFFAELLRLIVENPDSKKFSDNTVDGVRTRIWEYDDEKAYVHFEVRITLGVVGQSKFDSSSKFY